MKNIKTIITPIAFRGNGYPERDDLTPGFPRYYGRRKLTTNDTAIKAQENYLRQLFKYINPYTRLSAALKSTGSSKPAFYNIAQGLYYSDAVAVSFVAKPILKITCY